MIPEPDPSSALDVEATLARLAEILRIAPDAVEDDPRAARLAAMVRRMAVDGRGRGDPIRAVFGRLGDKWSTLLLLLLSAGTFGHAVLGRLAGVAGDDEKISQRMLTLRLRDLERDGMVRRTITPTIPPRVDYALSELGVNLVGQVEGVMAWVRAHDAEIRAARRRFDAEAREAD